MNHKNEVTLQSIAPSHEHIQYDGRIDFSNAEAPLFAYQGVSITCKFIGTELWATLENLEKGGKRFTNYFVVIIDGCEDKVLRMKRGKHEYCLCSDLERKEHTVQLFKRTEAKVGKTIFTGFSVDASTLLPLPPKPKKLVEFIGDSWMTGYGNEVSIPKEPNTGFNSKNEDYYGAWPAIISRKYGVRQMCTAISGRGVFRNNTGSSTVSIPNIYDRTLPTQNEPKWDFQKDPADLVFINLSANDFFPETEPNPVLLRHQDFVDSYVKFCLTIRETYPKAKIVCIFGRTLNDYWPENMFHSTRVNGYMAEIKEIFAEMSFDNIFQLELSAQTPPYGEDWHATKETHIELAGTIGTYMEELMGWQPIS